jgi:hypothetical protein
MYTIPYRSFKSLAERRCGRKVFVRIGGRRGDPNSPLWHNGEAELAAGFLQADEGVPALSADFTAGTAADWVPRHQCERGWSGS